MIQYDKYLSKCLYVTQIYQKHLSHYLKTELPYDPSLQKSEKLQMCDLIKAFLTRVADFEQLIRNDFFSFNKTQTIDENAKNSIAEELVKISEFLNKISAGSQLLYGVKQKIEAEIKTTPKIENSSMTKSIAKKKGKSINEQWLDSVAEQFYGNSRPREIVSTKKKTVQTKSKTFYKNSASEICAIIENENDILRYLEGFRSIKAQIIELKTEIRKIREKPHEHKSLLKRLDKIGANTVKIQTSNKLVMQEQADLLCQTKQIEKKIKEMESNNEKIVKRLKINMNAF